MKILVLLVFDTKVTAANANTQVHYNSKPYFTLRLVRMAVFIITIVLTFLQELLFLMQNVV